MPSRSDAVEGRLDLAREPLQRLVVERCGAVDVDVVEAELEIGRPPVDDELGRAEQALGASPVREPVPFSPRVRDLLRLRLRVADDRAPALQGSLDLRLVAADLIAPAAQ